MPRYVEFLAQLAGDTSSIPVEPCEEDLIDNDFADSVTSVPKISNFREAITSLEDVAIFLDSRGHIKEATVQRPAGYWM
jgi:hypothetical protein